MERNMLLFLVATLVTLLSSGGCYSISKGNEANHLDSHGFLGENSIDEPIYQPRFLPFFGGGGANNTAQKVVEALQNPENKTLQENLANGASDFALKTFGGNENVKKLIDIIKNPGNNTLQENLANAASDFALKTFGGDETVKKLIEMIRNPGNKTILENLIDVASDLALKRFGDDGTVKKVFDYLKSPDKGTRQKILVGLAADLALKVSKNDALLKKAINLFENPENKTMQENVLALAAEIAIRSSNGDELIKKVVEVFENPEKKTLQENLLNLAFEVSVRKFGLDPALKRVFEVIQNPGNKTFQENLMDIALDISLNKAGVDETMRKIARTLLIPGKKSLQENLMGLASELVKEKGSNVFGNILGKFLGENTVAGAKEKVGAVGQALKVGGGIFGKLLSQVGGNSILGKIGHAITGGSQKVGGVMTNIAGNDTAAGKAIGLLGNALEGGNITIQDAFKQASDIIVNSKTGPENIPQDVSQVINVMIGEDLSNNHENENATLLIKNLEEFVKRENIADIDIKGLDGLLEKEFKLPVSNSEIVQTGNAVNSEDPATPEEGKPAKEEELKEHEDQVGELSMSDSSFGMDPESLQINEEPVQENESASDGNRSEVKENNELVKEGKQPPMEEAEQSTEQNTDSENIDLEISEASPVSAMAEQFSDKIINQDPLQEEAESTKVSEPSAEVVKTDVDSVDLESNVPSAIVTPEEEQINTKIISEDSKHEEVNNRKPHILQTVTSPQDVGNQNVVVPNGVNFDSLIANNPFLKNNQSVLQLRNGVDGNLLELEITTVKINMG